MPELFGENLIRGKGLFARSIMRAQASSLPFTPVFAALVSIVNTKLPQVGELVLIRLIAQFRRAYKRNDKVSLEPPSQSRPSTKLLHSMLTPCRPSATPPRRLSRICATNMSLTKLSPYKSSSSVSRSRRTTRSRSPSRS